MKKKSVLFAAILSFGIGSSAPTALAAGPYQSSNMGYDVSFNISWPSPEPSFGFEVVGVSHGKAFTHNDKLPQQYRLAQFGTSLPTFYMNLNAPIGSTAVAKNTESPLDCSGSGNVPVCEAHNYGWNAAQDALSYSNGMGYHDQFLWWLDIEEANSWATSTDENDATIQGAIDYLNEQNIKVGIYSMKYMWDDIAGSGFVPVEHDTDGATSTSPVPTWMPIGPSSQVSAINACSQKKSFITGSPVWMVQYELSKNFLIFDRNIVC